MKQRFLRYLNNSRMCRAVEEWTMIFQTYAEIAEVLCFWQ